MILLTAVKRAAELAESLDPLSLWSSLQIALISAPFALFLELCFGRGMIFRKYRALVGYWFQFKPRARFYSDTLDLRSGAYKMQGGKRKEVRSYDFSRCEPRFIYQLPPRWYSWFFKPLGGCIYCFGTWVSIAVFVAAIGSPAGILSISGALQFVTVISWNYILIDLYQKFKTRFE